MNRHVYAHMVTRDEERRYLEAVLTALLPHVDALHVYDDGSRDDTVGLALDMGAVVTTRGTGTPAFLEDEAAFRQAAWVALEWELAPVDGDWVLAIDADEVLVAPAGLSPALDRTQGAVAVVLPIPEVFGFDGSTPLVRTDGWWGDLDAPRLVAYQEFGVFHPQAMASGSVPTYVTDGVMSRENEGVGLLHLGYAEAADRRAKYRRYAGRAGHSPAHVASILSPAHLEAWDGPAVEVWKGRR